MARRFTLRSSHLLMWSSPLLLLVLVFTISSRPLRPVTTSTTLPTATTTTRPTASTTTTDPATTTTDPATTTTGADRSATTSTLATTTTHASSGDSTTTSVVASERVDGGELSLSQPNAVVPLRGPGEWTLASSQAVASTLICAGRVHGVAATFRLAVGQSCQLNIVVNTGAPTTWTLNAVR